MRADRTSLVFTGAGHNMAGTGRVAIRSMLNREFSHADNGGIFPLNPGGPYHATADSAAKPRSIRSSIY